MDVAARRWRYEAGLHSAIVALETLICGLPVGADRDRRRSMVASLRRELLGGSGA